MSPKPPVRHEPTPGPSAPPSADERAFDRAFARWAARPPETPASIAARRIEHRLPAPKRPRRLLPIAPRSRGGRRFALAAAALVAVGLALTLSWALLRTGPPAPFSLPSTPPDKPARAAEALPVRGGSDNVLVIDLDARTTLYLNLGGT